MVRVQTVVHPDIIQVVIVVQKDKNGTQKQTLASTVRLGKVVDAHQKHPLAMETAIVFPIAQITVHVPLLTEIKSEPRAVIAMLVIV